MVDTLCPLTVRVFCFEIAHFGQRDSRRAVPPAAQTGRRVRKNAGVDPGRTLRYLDAQCGQNFVPGSRDIHNRSFRGRAHYAATAGLQNCHA